jgi:hypothetical protein
LEPSGEFIEKVTIDDVETVPDNEANTVSENSKLKTPFMSISVGCINTSIRRVVDVSSGFRD